MSTTLSTISRSAWGATTSLGRPTSGAKLHVYVHHTYRPTCPANALPGYERSVIRQIEVDHARRFGIGPGYSFLIFQSGRVYEGQGWGRIGAHTRNRNSSGYGICFVVDGTAERPSDAALEAFHAIRKQGVELGHLAPHHDYRPHSDFVATECPGPFVMNAVKSAIRVEVQPAEVRTARPTLRKGRGGANGSEEDFLAVRELQRLLEMEDRHQTGFFGDITEATVRNFQRAHGLLVDGIVGSKTWGELL